MAFVCRAYRNFRRYIFKHGQYSINRAKPVAVKLDAKTETRSLLPQTVEWSETLKGETFVYDDQTQKGALIFAFSRHCNTGFL